MKPTRTANLTTLAVVLAAVACVSVCAQGPEQLHLALTNNPLEMRAMWASLRAFETEANITSFCLIGMTSGDYNTTAYANSYTYYAGGWNGTLHNATFVGLRPSTVYYYMCGSAEYGFTQEYNFTTPPPPLTNDTVRFLCFGDMGVDHSEHTVAGMAADAVSNVTYTMVVNVGDSSYADDYDARTNSKINDEYFRNLEPIMARMPMMLVDGNHDVQFEYAAFLNRTYMPPSGDDPLSRFYFSFDYGPVHFLYFSTDGNHSTAPNSTEWEFMRADLEAADNNRAVTPWIIAVSHHPLYCSELVQFTRCHSEADVFKSNFEALFGQYKLDLYLSGHNHQYERSYPVFDNIVNTSYHNAEYPVYIVNGAAGDIEGMDPTWEIDVDFRAAHSVGLDTGYARMEVNRTALSWQFVNSDKMEIIDSFVMTKDDPLYSRRP